MCLRAKPPPLPPADQSEMEGKSREMGWKVGGGGEGGCCCYCYCIPHKGLVGFPHVAAHTRVSLRGGLGKANNNKEKTKK